MLESLQVRVSTVCMYGHLVETIEGTFSGSVNILYILALSFEVEDILLNILMS